MLHMVTFTINIPPMLAYIPYMDPMGCRTVMEELFQRMFTSINILGLALKFRSPSLVQDGTPWTHRQLAYHATCLAGRSPN